MKLQFKHQKFQADAAKAVVDVFAGQPYLTPTYMMDRGTGIFQIGMNEEDDFTGWRNQPLVPELSKRMILEQIQEIQRIYQITPSQKLEGEGYNLTIEMETGVGKTYTYIKTMFELNKHYGWSKFIVVVPSIAIREGVYKSFEVTQEHFAEEYGKKIRFFIYNYAQLTEIDRFASDNSINVMIINSQAFNARGKDARRIYMKLDELIMKNKELLLDRDPKRSPVRFIFSHSALREGWDNPNVFQICTLKQSGSDVRKRQEVGRGLRLCVNQDGERQDANVLGNDVHNINILTVIASESYDSFAKGLQSEIAEAVADRPRAITVDLFVGKVIKDSSGHEQVIDKDIADAIMYDLIINRYIDKKGALTDKYYEEKANGTLQVAEEVADCAASVVEIIGSIYDPKTMQPENARSNNVELHVDEEKIAMPEFKALWSKINAKSVYIVDFDTDELVQKAIASLDAKLRVAKIFFKVESGVMEEIKSKEALESGAAFIKETSASYGTQTRISVNSSVKYDLVGKLVEETKLTRKDIIAILRGIQKPVFEQFKDNPEEFIIKAAALINDEKATAIIQHITYDVLDERYGTEVFTDPTIRGKLGVNAMKAKKHLYDHVVFDSTNERDFAAELDTNTDVAVYVKLPDGFYISTPVGHYNPDWAIAFYEGKVKHIYFVAETKGSMSSMQLRLIEESKIHCAREHFKAISSDSVVYDVVDSYQSLLNKVMR